MINIDLIKLEALEEAISYPPYKEVKDINVIEVERFDYDLIHDNIINNEKLTNLEGARMQMLLDMIKLLSENQVKLNVSTHNYIGFYWRGLPILAVKYNNVEYETNNHRMMYVSVKVFKDELTQKAMINKFFKWGSYILGGIGALGVGYYYYKKSGE